MFTFYYCLANYLKISVHLPSYFGKEDVMLENLKLTYRTHMLIDVIHASYFSSYIETIESERDRFVGMANEFHSKHPDTGVKKKSN